MHVELARAERGGALHRFHITFEGGVFLRVVHHEHVRLDVDRLIRVLGESAEGVAHGLRPSRRRGEQAKRGRSGGEQHAAHRLRRE